MIDNKISPENSEAVIFNNNDVLDEVVWFVRILLRIFGFYHQPSDSIAWKIYGFFVVFVLLGYNVVRQLLLFEKDESFNSNFLNKIIITMFPLYCFLNALLMFIIHEKKTKILNFNLNFNKIFNEYQTETGKRIEMRAIKRIGIIITCISIIISIFIFSFSLISLFGPPEIQDFYSKDIKNPLEYFEFNGENNTTYRIIVAILQVFTISACFIVASYYFIYCIIMCRLLDFFNQSFKKFLLKNELILNDEIIYENEIGFERFRTWHLKLCNLVKLLNDCFKDYIFITLSMNVPVIILILYIVSDSNNCSNNFNKITLSIWFINAIILISSIVIAACRINVKVI
jgi:hypothetical protein